MRLMVPFIMRLMVPKLVFEPIVARATTKMSDYENE